jgi:hypothetical protein
LDDGRYDSPTRLSGLLWPVERIVMFLRMRQRVDRLEREIIPKGRVLALVWDGTSPLGPYAEQLAAFKARNDVGPRDTLVEVVITFDA